MPESSYWFYNRRNHVVHELPALGGYTLGGHKTMVTKLERTKNNPLLGNGFSADKKTCVLVVNLSEVHYNRNVKDFRKLELRVGPMHPL